MAKTHRSTSFPHAFRNRSVALLGLGYWGQNILRTLGQLQLKRLVVCDEAPHRLSQALEVVPHAKGVRHLDEILDDPEIDAVCVATPVEFHVQHAKAILRAGKHVFIEKPLSYSAKSARIIGDAARKARKRVMVGHIYLHHPAILQLRQWIASGKLGKIQWIRSTRCSLGPRVRHDVDVLWDYAIHDIYLIPFLMGKAASRVRADGRPCLKPPRADWVEFSMEFHGSRAVMHGFVSWLNPFKERTLMVVGSKGIAVFDELKQPCLTFYRCGYAPHKGMDRWGNLGLRLFDDGREELSLDCQQSLSRELAHFLSHLETKAPPHASFADGLTTIRLLEKLSSSLAKKGRWVSVS